MKLESGVDDARSLRRLFSTTFHVAKDELGNLFTQEQCERMTGAERAKLELLNQVEQFKKGVK